MRTAAHPELESKLLAWIQAVNALFRFSNVGTSVSVIIQKANEIATELGISSFKANTGWFSRFQSRNSIVRVLLHGDAGDVDLSNSELQASAANIRCTLATFPPERIFNMDETGIFYRVLPNSLYISKSDANRNMRGVSRMHSKDRVTLVLAVNATGTCRIPILMIGKAAHPRCKVDKVKYNAVVYASQSNAWMDASICQHWFDKVFLPSVKKFTTEPVVLLWDNLASHKVSMDPATAAQVSIVPLPKNATSVYQPLDQGIIHTLKRAYRRTMVGRIIANLDSIHELRQVGAGMTAGTAGLDQQMPANLADLASIVSDEWMGLSSTTISNCFIKSSILPTPAVDALRHLAARSLILATSPQPSPQPSPPAPPASRDDGALHAVHQETGNSISISPQLQAEIDAIVDIENDPRFLKEVFDAEAAACLDTAPIAESTLPPPPPPPSNEPETAALAAQHEPIAKVPEPSIPNSTTLPDFRSQPLPQDPNEEAILGRARLLRKLQQEGSISEEQFNAHLTKVFLSYGFY